jgi:hypothetical protein
MSVATLFGYGPSPDELVSVMMLFCSLNRNCVTEASLNWVLGKVGDTSSFEVPVCFQFGGRGRLRAFKGSEGDSTMEEG